ncbi:MAG: hypothetical protein CSA81_12450 [Acidobacteria bacterium]|nr:MAG: hypothetical protein CSA81_12450 [Acidobacteriota bacterium]PIE88881.1 MAG: hypothetical protein CR997_14010 [Acidobacteriota bacterium]
MRGLKGLFPSFKNIILTVVFALIAALLFKSFFDERGLIRGKKLKAKCEEKQNEVKRLEMENELLRQEIRELKKPNSRRLEILGRTEFGMAKQGEIVFSFPKQSEKDQAQNNQIR